jgi:mono/diheme cytochrome c family protein
MKIKIQLFTALLIGGVTLLYGCGGNQSETSSSEENVENTQPAQAAPVDTKAKSDSKGVGRFTSVEVGPIEHETAEKGEALFVSKCSACHKPTDVKVVGPGLKGVTQRRTPEWIMNMITNPEEMTKKDPVAKALFEEHLVQMTFQNASDDEARQILEFLRENDTK